MFLDRRSAVNIGPKWKLVPGPASPTEPSPLTSQRSAKRPTWKMSESAKCPFTPSTESPSTWRSAGRPRSLEFAYALVAAYASSQSVMPTPRDNVPPTWFAESVVTRAPPVGLTHGKSGEQRNPPEKKSTMNPTRSCPAAAPCAYCMRKRPAEPASVLDS